MTRDELARFVGTEAANISQTFALKNRSYGGDSDAFHNFRETARRVFKSEDWHSMFRVLLTLVDKHYVALCNNGLYDPEAEERLRDIAVYCLIGLGMLAEMRREGGGK